MPAASGNPVVGKMSSRVLNMKFMQRKSNPTESSDKNEKTEDTKDEKLHIKDTSEWSFGSRGKIGILANIKNKKLKTANNKTPVTLSQTVLNKKFYNLEVNKDNLLIGKQKLGIKDELTEELEKGVEEPKEKDLGTLFKESNEMNKKSKKRKSEADSDSDSDYNPAKKMKN